MPHVLRLVLGLLLVSRSVAQREIGDVVVAGDTQVASVTISASSAELQNLALRAFSTHGRFRPVASGGSYKFTFTAAGANQVTVAITRGSAGTPVHTETVTGTSLRQALLKAADVAVVKTTGLKGYFAGRLAFVSDRGGQQTILTGDLFFGEVLSHPVQGKQIIGPRWAPDGGRIIYTSYRTGFPDIYVLDLRTHQQNVFASFKGTNSGAQFSLTARAWPWCSPARATRRSMSATPRGRQIKRLDTAAIESSPVVA